MRLWLGFFWGVYNSLIRVWRGAALSDFQNSEVLPLSPRNSKRSFHMELSWLQFPHRLFESFWWHFKQSAKWYETGFQQQEVDDERRNCSASVVQIGFRSLWQLSCSCWSFGCPSGLWTVEMILKRWTSRQGWSWNILWSNLIRSRCSPAGPWFFV